MIHSRNIILFISLSIGFLAACRQNVRNEVAEKNPFFNVSNFSALENYLPESLDSIKTIDLDYNNSMEEGFIIPSENQTASGYFTFSFSVRNNTKSAQKYLYKIFYQNESYKFPELDSLTGKEHEYANENFYGSWEDSTYEFKSTMEIPADGKDYRITDSVRIVGNPRNEIHCYQNGVNKRWRRNLRVGIYDFLLAVSLPDTGTVNSIPRHIKNICLKNGSRFESPYYYFKYGEGTKLPGLLTVTSNVLLKVIARPDLGAGIYINGWQFKSGNMDASFNSGCSSDTFMYHKAAFAQFVHYIDASTNLENIPLVRDVLNEGYTKREYNWNRSFYLRDELISTTPKTAEIPCQTVYSDPINKKIVIHNPGTESGKWRKENVGIISRQGMSYGKIRVKAKLSELLNKDNMWNGLTNAIWLINQEGGEDGWNLRRPCRKEGYMENYWGGRDDKRVPQVGYAEIDFEILKTPSYCPAQDFPPVYKIPKPDRFNESSWNVPWPEEITKHDADITVACTNWDMACWEPKDFGVGCNSVSYQGQTFEAHRWDHWYRAVTEKTYAPDDSLFASPYYYFEIDWRPTEIIWRIGPNPENMRIVGYMNDKMTSIPNNQLLLIVTQEFHNTKWWPGSPYQQSNIPFPRNDIFGEIYEVVIE